MASPPSPSPDCDEVEFVRVPGSLPCPACQKNAQDHPWFTRCLSWQGLPYLRVLCDGTLVKL